MGIVIADGGGTPRATRLLAYVWGPPDPEPEPDAAAIDVSLDLAAAR